MFQKFTIKIKLIVTSSKNNNPHYYTIINTCVLPMLCSAAHGLMQLPCWPLLVLDWPPQIVSLCTRLTAHLLNQLAYGMQQEGCFSIWVHSGRPYSLLKRPIFFRIYLS